MHSIFVLVQSQKDHNNNDKLDILKKMGKDDEIVNTIRENLQLGSWDGARRAIVTELENLGIPGHWEMDVAHKDTASPLKFEESTSEIKNIVQDINPEIELENGLWEIPEPAEILHAGLALEIEEQIRPNSTDDFFAKSTGTGSTALIEEPRLPMAYSPGDTLSNIRGDDDRCFQAVA